MKDSEFLKFLEAFEKKVIIEGVRSGRIGKREMVALRNGKLTRTPFGKAVGKVLQSDVPLAIDYYGMTKKSTGFFNMIESLRNEHSKKQLKMVEAPVVHFASIRMEDVAAICEDLELVAKFPQFKNAVLIKRGFREGGE